MKLEDYLDSIPPDRRARVDSIRSLIHDMYPDAIESMRYKMPTFEYRDGWIALANQKHHVSLYTCGEHHLTAFREKHPAISTGKGCIRFRDKDELPVTALKQVIRHAMRQPKDI